MKLKKIYNGVFDKGWYGLKMFSETGTLFVLETETDVPPPFFPRLPIKTVSYSLNIY